MKHATAAELAERHDTQDRDLTTVFDEEAMVIQQGRYRAENAAETSARAHRDDEFYYITAGSGKMRVGDETSDVNAGDMIYVEGGVEHEFFDLDEELRTLKVFASP